ncbi:hypothetical protein [Novosphingobium sediminicola]|uniref:DNA-binding response OmpR family regulator n=1 Tax=Novosphingobium sediminicola TaxID=563162 RepID=A0A7W6G7R0_9SPHN|nr:hypothetical protein [Novosphingobium sediminicola]MBB3957174.1 DNA-binding response OmpR family regulator [Novosphingobium sediminicola]
MTHALIIDDNMIFSHSVQKRLEGIGFRSFDKTWTEAQALTAADRRNPDLIVIGDDVEEGSALRAAQAITEKVPVPVLMVTADPIRAKLAIEDQGTVKGPFLLNQIEEAVKQARHVSPRSLDE